MSIYLLVNILTIFYIFFIWYIVFRKYNNSSWLYFLIFSLSLWIWFILYFLTFFSTQNTDILLFYSRFAYWISIIWLYSFLLFISFFSIKKRNKFTKYNKIIFIIFLFILLFYIKTPFIIESMYFDNSKKDFYEVPWFLYNLHILFSIFFIPLLIFTSFYKFKKISDINKIRLKYILFWLIIFVSLWFIFQLILPIYGVHIFEKSMIFFVVPFLFFTLYSVRKYSFIDFNFRFLKFIIYFISLWLTIISYSLFKSVILLQEHSFIDFWWFANGFNYIDLSFWIILFIFINTYLQSKINIDKEYTNFIFELNKIKEKIIYLTDIKSLNIFLWKEVSKKFNVNLAFIKIFDDSNYGELFNFFSKEINTDFFINDIVFIEENKNKFDKCKIKKELDKDIFIIFPLKEYSWKVIWALFLWRKPFNELYYLEEINIIKDFTSFLVWHLKYISVYSKLNDLNINLDKRVDEKTIEYNTLISKQKEFISMSSHEIKTPITSISLQVENLYDDVKNWEINRKDLIEEIYILKKQILSITDLVKNIFTVQKYDIKNVWLYLEKIKLSDIIISEYDIVRRIYPDIKFTINISEKIWFLNIDKIQFTQVISNLYNNAIKFADINSPIIKVSVFINKNNLIISFEDNWKWFKNWEEKNIFEKYSTWNWYSIWIWMWLYLCKKIVELHWWNINVKNSKELWWAKFKISIPCK